MIALDFPASR